MVHTIVWAPERNSNPSIEGAEPILNIQTTQFLLEGKLPYKPSFSSNLRPLALATKARRIACQGALSPDLAHKGIHKLP
jgi:hypothetical protein